MVVTPATIFNRSVLMSAHIMSEVARIKMSLLLDLWSALKGIRATAKAVRVLIHASQYEWQLQSRG
ncbi:MAG: hypothetical protein J6Q62_01640 [Alistipes sp.]|nr:hypothetical protein [Alistipes sp.]